MRHKRKKKERLANTLKRVIKKHYRLITGYAGWRSAAVSEKIRKPNRWEKVKKTKVEKSLFKFKILDLVNNGKIGCSIFKRSFDLLLKKNKYI